jgi:tetratricopeptide (TPR) repeat protein
VSPRITLCLIARDEEAMLPACLESARGAVDEIVLVDTGSADRTAALARAAGARVVEQAWRDDFSAPRNEALRHATGDLVLQLDCDERLAPGAAPALRRAAAEGGFDLGLLPLHNASRLDAPAAQVASGRARAGMPVWLPRLLRRCPDLAWRGVVHESVQQWFLEGKRRARAVAADIVHYGAVPDLRARRGKAERNAALLRRRLAAEPGDAEAAGRLAIELLEAGDAAGAAEAVRRGWEAAGAVPPEHSLLALAAAGGMLALRRGDAGGALECAGRGRTRGDHADLDFIEGCALETLALREPAGSEARRERAGEAARAYRAAVERDSAPALQRFTAPDEHRLRLGSALLLAGRVPEAREVLAPLAAERPELAGARLAMAEAELDSGAPGRALELLEPLLGEGPDGWVLAAAAALRLGARGDSRALLARAAERAARGWIWPARRQRLAALEGELGGPR